MIKLKYNNREYSFELNYYKVIYTLPTEFDIHLTKIFVDGEKLQSTMNNLLVDDELCTRLFYWCLGGETSLNLNLEDFIKGLKDPKELTEFRDAFWDEVVSFSDPLRKQALKDLWKSYRDLLKKRLSQGIEQTSTDS
jgi:hypothetical protein